MKKGLLGKILSACSLVIFMSGCTSLDYVGEDTTDSAIKVSTITTKENFVLKTVKKTDGYADVSIGISQTPLEEILVLYIAIHNNLPDTNYKFDVSDIAVKSPKGTMSFLQPNNFINAYANSQAVQYSNFMNAGTALGGFASLQNAYNQNSASNSYINSDNSGIQSETNELQATIKGIQNHTTTTYKFINPNSSDYFYIFMQTPDEYPITVDYKGLTYKFGGR